ncbi:histamine H3 receptor-like [Mixophyes fleayi]|uniref:histamine H3 receptor-like n=1 Tax=Mixophyes fleayi TaxID=3061075 RepID=UPI003F4DEC06
MTADLQFSETAKIMTMLLISLFILLTVLGNILVMMAFIVEKSLRTQSNFFLLNLAICDFFIGTFTSPMYALYALTGRWILGRYICKMWLIADYMMTTASAFNIVLISYDRFLSVTKAVLYRSLQKDHSQTVLKMAAVWVMSFLLYSPAILFWESVLGKKDLADSVCIPAFYDSWYFHLGTSVFDFLIPLVSISYFNLSIYLNISKRSRKKRQSSVPHLSGGNDIRPFTIATNQVLFSAQLDGIMTMAPVTKRVRKSLRQCFSRTMFSSSSHKDNIHNTYNVRVINLTRDKKVAKSLAILVCIFAICWAPYTFLIVTRTACQGYCIPSYWYDITLWVLYLNSAINPVLYPLCHKSFRKAFTIILHLCM